MKKNIAFLSVLFIECITNTDFSHNHNTYDHNYILFGKQMYR